MILTKSVYDKKEESDGLRILISRYWPRGVKKDHFDKWDRTLSPPSTLLKQYKQGLLSFETFACIFEVCLRTHAESWTSIVMASVYPKDITLLCYEREGKNCHRYIVKELIENLALKLKGNLLEVSS